MARGKLTAEAYIKVDGKDVLVYERDADGNVTWHMPREEFKLYEEKMLENVSKSVSEYIVNNPDSGIWDA